MCHLLQHLLRNDPLCHPGGCHWNNHIGVNVVLPALLAQSVGQTHQSQLGRAVVGLAKVAIESCH